MDGNISPIPSLESAFLQPACKADSYIAHEAAARWRPEMPSQDRPFQDFDPRRAA